MHKKISKVLIMAGGTGGHVFPALAIAQACKEQGIEVYWLGTKVGLEAEKVPAAGIPIYYLPIAGMRGKSLLQLIQLPWKIIKAVFQAIRIIHQLKPELLIGMGGFVSGPGGLAAWLLRKKLVIHEQNAVPGLTNRWLSHLSQETFTAFPEIFPHNKKAICVGNPVNTKIAALPAPAERFAGRTGPLRVLVVGGSLRALAINTLLPQALALIDKEKFPEIWHQTGKKHLEKTQAAYQEHAITAKIVPFIEDMSAAYAWADIVICRAGALTVSELAAAGIGSILIPFPYAVDDHQTKNAAYLVEAGAARLIQQSVLTPEILKDMLLSFDRKILLEMAERAYVLRKIDAADQILKVALLD